jgi:succinoglycan biosynthesis transport protein ExoP
VILNKTDMAELGKFTNFGGTERYRHKYTSYYTEETPKMRETAEADA